MFSGLMRHAMNERLAWHGDANMDVFAMGKNDMFLYKGNGWDQMSTHKKKFDSGAPILN